MIKANELRIGNWVQRPKDIRIDILDGGQIYWLVNHVMIRDCEHYKDKWAFEPIPLTPEILEKCGFVWEDIQTHTDKTTRGMWKSIMMMLPTNNGYWYSAPFGYPLNLERTLYLHQLQNLYFALTGEELIIDL